MKQKFLVLAASIFIFSGAALAQPYYPGYRHMQQQQEPGPAAILQRGLQSLTRFMDGQDRPRTKQQLRFIEREIAPYFDFEYMASWVAGHRWQQMNEHQRQAFESRLKQEFFTAMVQKLTGFHGQQVRVLRARRGRDGQVTVPVAIQNPQGYPAKLDFRFYRGDDGWKIYDVAANGSSAVVYYRNLFRERLQQHPSRRSGYPRVR